MKIRRQPTRSPTFQPFDLVVTVETEEDYTLLSAIAKATCRIPFAVMDPDDTILKRAVRTPMSAIGQRVRQLLEDLNAQLLGRE